MRGGGATEGGALAAGGPAAEDVAAAAFRVVAEAARAATAARVPVEGNLRSARAGARDFVVTFFGDVIVLQADHAAVLEADDFHAVRFRPEVERFVRPGLAAVVPERTVIGPTQQVQNFRLRHARVQAEELVRMVRARQG